MQAIYASVADPDDFCPDRDPTFPFGDDRIWIQILAHKIFVRTFYNTKFFAQKSNLNFIFASTLAFG
jgi:hypothetical protein